MTMMLKASTTTQNRIQAEEGAKASDGIDGHQLMWLNYLSAVCGFITSATLMALAIFGRKKK
jgi:hypothetical protein